MLIEGQGFVRCIKDQNDEPLFHTSLAASCLTAVGQVPDYALMGIWYGMDGDTEDELENSMVFFWAEQSIDRWQCRKLFPFFRGDSHIDLGVDGALCQRLL